MIEVFSLFQRLCRFYYRETILKKLFVRSSGGGQVSSLISQLKSSTCLTMRVEYLSALGGSRLNRRSALNLGLVFLSRRS
jgi:hypothetical protein